MPESMRPREKLMLKGETALSEVELLAIVLGGGTRKINALDLAMRILGRHKSLRQLREASLEELMEIKGVGPAKAVGIKAALELGRRAAIDTPTKMYIKSPEDVINAAAGVNMEEMRYFDRE